jgi:acetolactate synthase-1/2/3 large subunit
MVRQLHATDKGRGTQLHEEWLTWCHDLRQKYPVVSSRQLAEGPPVNPYGFIDALFEYLKDDDVVVCGNATACIVPYQAGKLKMGQRLISNSGSASMGYDLPAAIGAAVARGGKRVICLAGDGSIQMNIQELQTLVQYQLPVKVLVLNNNGYLSIRSTQAGFFGRLVGEGPESGVSFPSMIKLAEAYGISTFDFLSLRDLDRLHEELDRPGPSLIDVHLDVTQGFEPRVRSRQLPDGTIVSPNLEDMYPFLSEEELASNMVGALQKDLK